MYATTFMVRSHREALAIKREMSEIISTSQQKFVDDTIS